MGAVIIGLMGPKERFFHCQINKWVVLNAPKDTGCWINRKHNDLYANTIKTVSPLSKTTLEMMLWFLYLGVLLLVLGGILYFIRSTNTKTASDSRPVIWWYVDDGEANTKSWASFEDRGTYDPIEPYLSLCLDRARRLWGQEWNIRPIIGRRAALALLTSDADDKKLKKIEPPHDVIRTPPALWMAWFRTTLLAQRGGLWLDGSVIPLCSGSTLLQRVSDTVLTFGSDPDEALSTAALTGPQSPAAGNSAGWAAAPGHPMWSGLSTAIAAVVAAGPPSWSAFDARRSMRKLWDTHCASVTQIDRKAEVSRTPYGRRLNYVDLFDRTEVDVDITEALWCPLPNGRDALERATPYLWFTRLSKEQIMESDFWWAKMART
jgi:hypothetical protein